MENNFLILGKIIYKEREEYFGIYKEDRKRHIYIIGKTGTGKTTLLLNMMKKDIENGEGLAFFDPHGDAIFKILKYIPKHRLEDVIFLNPGDLDHPFGFNPLEEVDYYKRHLVVSTILSVFKKIWKDAWSARMEYILQNAVLTLLEYPGATLLDINRILSEDSFRKNIVKNLKDPVVKAFWENEFEKYHLQFRTEAIAPIQNKVGQFISNPLIRNIIGQSKSTLDLREIMDERKILLVNLSIGMIGEASAQLLGGLFIGSIFLKAMERVNIPEEKRQDFYLYIDEFQNFATESFVNILSESRKFGLSLILANQYLDQVDESIKKAIFGNIGSFIVFRIGYNDANIFFEEFERSIYPENFVNLPNFYAFAKIIYKGKPEKPFLCQTLPLEKEPEVNYVDEILSYNHLKYTLPREIVEARIKRIYLSQKQGGVTFCRICGIQFKSETGIEICPDCEKRSFAKGISLKELAKKDLIVKMKKEKENKKVDLDSILERLEKNEGE
jgi:hypothetical protein